MRPYEVMVIFDAELEEETIRAAVDRHATQLIESKGAELGPVDFWGKRRFAYQLKHRWEGYYVVLQAKAEPAAMDELGRTLSLADEVLRHKVLRIPEQVYGKLGTPAEQSQAPRASPGRAGGPQMADNTVTIVGNVTRDPEIRYTAGGAGERTFGVAVNRRWQNRQTQEWEERTSFFNVVCWREMAENVAESLGKGSRVVVTGRLEQRTWETENGEKRRVVEIVADEVGPSLRWATAPGHPQRAPRRRRLRRRWRRRWRWRRRRWRRRRRAPRRWRRATSAAAAPCWRRLRRPSARSPSRSRSDDMARQQRGSDARATATTASPKKKVSILNQEPIDWIDYKDVNLLRRFMSERAKIRARRVTGNDAQQQREVARAIRVAREMALLPVQRAPGHAPQQGQARPRPRRPRRCGPRPRGAACRAAGRRTAARWRASRRVELDVRRSTRSMRRTTVDAIEVEAEVDARSRSTRVPRSRSGVVKIVLREDVETLGHKGDLARGRRRLRPQLPRAARARDEGDQGRRRAGRVDASQPRRARRARPRGRARRSPSRLDGRAIQVTARAGEGGKLFGSVTSADIADAVPRPPGSSSTAARSTLAEPLKELGAVEVPVRLHAEVDRDGHGRGRRRLTRTPRTRRSRSSSPRAPGERPEARLLARRSCHTPRL